jgi:hypothetical protein
MPGLIITLMTETMETWLTICSGLMQLQLDQFSGVTKKVVKRLLKNYRQLREHGYIIPSSYMQQV